MKKEWVILKPQEELISSLIQELHISRTLAHLLINRGIKDSFEASQFIDPSLKNLPSPFLMKDMKKAVTRLIKAIQNKESIYVYGDYDVDGVTAAACLIHFFRELGINIGFHIPHRLKEGYGLHLEALAHIQKQGAKVVITADCGISNADEANAASELGIDLIITDHHIVPPELPQAHAVLNPLRKDSDFPDLYLAGVGVVFNLLMALRNELRASGYFEKMREGHRPEPNLKDYLDLVALGTIADMVPLKASNHILVKEGLKILSQRKRLGVKALLDVSGIQKETIGTYEVAYGLAPRINAGGRLSTAEKAVQLLITSDYIEAQAIANELNNENNKRKLLQGEIFEAAIKLIEKNKYHEKAAIILSSPLWHAGVIGIVASKVVEKYYRPTCLISEEGDIAKGSCRSIETLHILEVLKECREILKNFGGHKAAAGFSIQKDKILEFRNQFEKVTRQKLKASDFIPKIVVDMEIDLKDIHQNLLDDIERLSPFGRGNPKPLFVTRSFKVRRSSIVGQKHLKLFLEGEDQYLEAIGFQMSAYAADVSKIKSILYGLSLNEWQGVKSIQLNLEDLAF